MFHFKKFSWPKQNSRPRGMLIVSLAVILSMLILLLSMMLFLSSSSLQGNKATDASARGRQCMLESIEAANIDVSAGTIATACAGLNGYCLDYVSKTCQYCDDAYKYTCSTGSNCSSMITYVEDGAKRLVFDVTCDSGSHYSYEMLFNPTNNAEFINP